MWDLFSQLKLSATACAWDLDGELLNKEYKKLKYLGMKYISALCGTLKISHFVQFSL